MRGSFSVPHLAARFTLTLCLGCPLAFPAADDTRPAPPAGASECVKANPLPPSGKGPRGIENFGVVAPLIYRGGQPTTEGFRELKTMGVTTVVSFRHEKGENSIERRALGSLGMRFVSLPWSAMELPPDKEVRAFLELLRNNPNEKFFVHCQQGRDRTGTMIAVYRIAVDHWCPESAVAEMRSYHYHHFFFPRLETYVRHFPDRLAADNTLAGGVSTAVAP